MTQTATLIPMVPGGLWMVPPGSDVPPVYVVDLAHQHRLKTRTLEEGGPWQVVPDPRDPQAVRMQSEEASLAKELARLQATKVQRLREEEMRAEIAKLKAELAATPEEVGAVSRAKK